MQPTTMNSLPLKKIFQQNMVFSNTTIFNGTEFQLAYHTLSSLFELC
jgi:hypothetical protein